MPDPTPAPRPSWLRRAVEWLKACAAENALVAGEFARQNLHRLRLASPSIVLVNLIVVLMFVSNGAAADARGARWWMAVLLIQGVMAATFAALGLLAH